MQPLLESDPNLEDTRIARIFVRFPWRKPSFLRKHIGVKISKIPKRCPSLSLPVNGEGTHFPPLTGGLRGGG